MIFAQALAARMLCETATGRSRACGRCPSCNWLAAGNHPDYRLVEPEADESGETENEAEDGLTKRKSDQIRIHQIRALDDFISIGTHRQGYRVIVLRPAEAMNPAAANSLLKILEEPTPNTLFILISNQKKGVLPTVRSRCRVIDFAKPPLTDALAWLRAKGVEDAAELLARAGGMPLAAAEEVRHQDKFRAFLRDLAGIGQSGVVAIAGRWETWLKENRAGEVPLARATLVAWMQKWLFDLVLVRMGGRALYHVGESDQLRETAERASLAALFDCYNDLLRIRAVCQHPLNARLFLEDLLSRYARAVATTR